MSPNQACWQAQSITWQRQAKSAKQSAYSRKLSLEARSWGLDWQLDHWEPKWRRGMERSNLYATGWGLLTTHKLKFQSYARATATAAVRERPDNNTRGRSSQNPNLEQQIRSINISIMIITESSQHVLKSLQLRLEHLPILSTKISWNKLKKQLQISKIWARRKQIEKPVGHCRVQKCFS